MEESQVFALSGYHKAQCNATSSQGTGQCYDNTPSKLVFFIQPNTRRKEDLKQLHLFI